MRTIFKVSAKSNPNSVAGAIAGSLSRNETIMIQTIGAASVNQAMKAVAISNGFIAPSGRTIICTPSFGECEINGETKTTMNLNINYQSI